MPTSALFPLTEPAFERDEIPGVEKSLLFYRAMAWIVGVLLVALTLIAMPLKYLGGMAGPVTYIGIAHGWLYPVLLIAAYNLYRRTGWAWQWLLAIALAGTVPFLSFVAEHFATRDVRRRLEQVRASDAAAS